MAGIFSGSTGGVPNWAWGLAIVGGLGVGVFVLRNRQAGTDASAPTYQLPSADYSPQDLGPADHEIIVVPTPTPASGSGGTVPDRQPTSEPERGRTVLAARMRVRGLFTWDDLDTGLPVRSQPSPAGKLIARVPFGSLVPIVGDKISGPMAVEPRYFADTARNTTWYRTASGGYLSAVDVVSVDNVTEAEIKAA